MARHSSATQGEETSTLNEKQSTPNEQTSTRRKETSHEDESEQHVERSIPLQQSSRGSIRASRSGADEDVRAPSESIDASLKRRARLLISNSSIPRQTRSLIRYALEIKDPYLSQVVRRVEEGEMTIECLHIE
jgi:hypothetical protein